MKCNKLQSNKKPDNQLTRILTSFNHNLPNLSCHVTSSPIYYYLSPLRKTIHQNYFNPLVNHKHHIKNKKKEKT